MSKRWMVVIYYVQLCVVAVGLGFYNLYAIDIYLYSVYVYSLQLFKDLVGKPLCCSHMSFIIY